MVLTKQLSAMKNNSTTELDCIIKMSTISDVTRNKFLSSVMVLDTETTNLKPEQAEIVELAGAKYDGNTWQVKDMLLGSVYPIPPEASAKNHISQRMINGLPTFKQSTKQVIDILKWSNNEYYVAHNSNYDQTVLAKSWIECDRLSDAEIALDKSKWICTHRLSKQLLEIEFDDIQYNLNYLRYKLDLPIQDGIESHRAGADTLVCATLFEFLVDYAINKNLVNNNSDLGEQIHNLCWKPILSDKWPFGKYRNKLLSDIPTDYFVWAIDNLNNLNSSHEEYDPDLTESVRHELENRLNLSLVAA